MFSLKDGDVVMSAWGEECSGPGWFNTPMFVLVYNSLDGKNRIECIQPEEQSEQMRDFISVSHLINRKLVYAVRNLVEEHAT